MSERQVTPPGIERKPDETLHIHLSVHLSWVDRWRVLWGKGIHLRTTTDLWFHELPELLLTPTRTQTHIDHFFPAKPQAEAEVVKDSQTRLPPSAHHSALPKSPAASRLIGSVLEAQAKTELSEAAKRALKDPALMYMCPCGCPMPQHDVGGCLNGCSLVQCVPHPEKE